jgi:tetratricopeptide (TPR) repeat protein
MSLSYFFPIILATGITITFLTISRKHKFWLAVWCYYVLTLLPVLGIIQVGGQAMADRYTYLPSLGPFLIAGAITSAVYEKVTPFKRWISILRTGGIVAAIAVAGSLSYLTIQQIGIWKDGLSLWDYVIEKEPLQVPHAYNNRGAILLGKGLISEATEHFQIAIKLEPGYADAYNNLCLAFKSKGLYGKAIEQCRTAIGLKPDYAEAHNNLGVAYKAEGLVDKAMEQYRIALSLRPDYAEALFNLGIVCLDRGDLETARWAFEAGLKLRPDDYKARQVFNRIISR